MNRKLLYLAIAAAVLIGGYFALRAVRESLQSFDPQLVLSKRDRLVRKNAQFLGRDRVAAKYRVDLTGARGLTCFAHYRIPVGNGRLPAALLLYSNPGHDDLAARLDEVTRINEIAVLALNVDSCFGGPTRDERSVYTAIQLCMDYLDSHFTIDSNRVFLAGLDRGNLYVLPEAALEPAEITGVALNLPLELKGSGALRAAATWGKQHATARSLIVTPGSAAPTALAQWSRLAGSANADVTRQATAGTMVALLSESVDWMLGPRTDSTSVNSAPPTAEELRVRTIPMKRK
jgi:hypothetical protein